MKPRHLSESQHALVLKTLDRSIGLELCIEWLARTGARSEELSRLTTSDIDIQGGVVIMPAAKGSNRRAIPLPKDLLVTTTTMLRDKPMHLAMGYDLGASFKSALRAAWTRFRVRVLGPEGSHCSLHGLRATFAVLIYNRTHNDLLLAQELLGHKNIQNTLAYTRLTRSKSFRTKILRAVGG
jgi:integrase